MSNVSANKIDKINSLGHHVQLVWFLGINFTLFDLYFNLESQVDLKFPQEFDSNSKWFVQNKHERVSLGNCLIPQTVKAAPDCCDQWKCTNWILKSSSQEDGVGAVWPGRSQSHPPVSLLSQWLEIVTGSQFLFNIRQKCPSFTIIKNKRSPVHWSDQLAREQLASFKPKRFSLYF